jgi:hypothetical protein
MSAEDVREPKRRKLREEYVQHLATDTTRYINDLAEINGGLVTVPEIAAFAFLQLQGHLLALRVIQALGRSDDEFDAMVEEVAHRACEVIPEQYQVPLVMNTLVWESDDEE